MAAENLPHTRQWNPYIELQRRQWQPVSGRESSVLQVELQYPVWATAILNVPVIASQACCVCELVETALDPPLRLELGNMAHLPVHAL